MAEMKKIIFSKKFWNKLNKLIGCEIEEAKDKYIRKTLKSQEYWERLAKRRIRKIHYMQRIIRKFERK